MAGNLYHALLRAAAGAGDRLFLDTGDARSIAYSELDRRVAAVASALLSAGIKPGDRVAAQVATSPEAVLLYLASLRTGSLFLPLNSRTAERHVGHDCLRHVNSWGSQD